MDLHSAPTIGNEQQEVRLKDWTTAERRAFTRSFVYSRGWSVQQIGNALLGDQPAYLCYEYSVFGDCILPAELKCSILTVCRARSRKICAVVNHFDVALRNKISSRDASITILADGDYSSQRPVDQAREETLPKRRAANDVSFRMR